MTATLYNITDYRWRFEQKFKWRNFMTLKSGTTGGDVQVTDITQKRRPTPATIPASAQQNRQADHSTLPPIRITQATKRLIDEGDYDEAVCVNAFHRWNQQFGRWEVILEFAFNAPVPAGIPIPMHVNMGRGEEPELKADHWLARLIERFGALPNLKGWRFRVTVETVKGRPNDKVERPESEWYSRVRRAILWDDYVRSSLKERF